VVIGPGYVGLRPVSGPRAGADGEFGLKQIGFFLVNSASAALFLKDGL
jgi:hypothetical protein